MSESSKLLPAVYQTSPECGHCYTSLEDDGDGYSCPPCGLYWRYDSMDDPAQFLDDEAEPCGREGQARVDLSNADVTAVYRELPCPLPAGHSSQHLHPYDRIEEES
ncbi:hypothetical protein HOT42_gp89 [Microbacterium phage Metamorphoo]|uniref:Uncharacterized protein n=1 Tax=Microbacterium phage Metamorphoo TaxID=2201437 RepID=A0A2Z4Q7G3_9CAUD|nr:hypothetical protein HOT42_gp89 [Microbacterium phage Metamorphoo]AWY05438.1 hypothetical protein SEA_METAMORPHOO_88 [Microbacterium phage Metamorphoo]